MSGLQRDESADVDELGLVPATHGVIPRSIERLFAEIEREKRGAVGTLFSVYCSFIEIYNEKIYDILSPDVPTSGNQSPDAKAAASSGSLTQRSRWNSSTSAKDAKNLPIRQKVDGSVFVDGMTSRNVGSQAELLQAFCEGSLHREVRDNLYNHFSSRGHAVFQITLRRTVADDESNKTSANKTRLSRLFFVDLAGSEKWHVHGSDLTDKYASELASINKSLSALTNCVMALTQKDRSHVPFRDSALTRLLQPCLQGSGRTAFIVTISPSKGSLEESFATLRFAERLRAIRCRPVRRSLLSSEMLGEQRLYYERQIQAMRVEVNRLRDLLRKASQRPNETTRSSSKDALVEENRRLKELLLQSERSRLVESTQKTSTQPRDQLTTLETQLQSKEARLNWMLEAEMEAQNANRQTVSRSWAVETRLRRQLVAVPSPMRDTQPDPDSGVRGEGKLRSRSVTNNLVVKPIKASSILKLVGSSSVDGSGKTRDEIIEEYKRARRVELQTMMRTMVQK
ncbi:Kinesin [Phytophthora megakarya]|uniref:Kinesin-like protein n=1 Tax=Phytophthora megakarya TaxID=4795 RepID=A0A225X5N3_9STRA|nr:Kinesin [Phytophthora megakarya]